MTSETTRQWYRRYRNDKKTILLKEDTYIRLKQHGKFGETWNDIIVRILDENDDLKKKIEEEEIVQVGDVKTTLSNIKRQVEAKEEEEE